MTNVTGSSQPEFKDGFVEAMPDAKQTALGNAGIIAGYLLAKGKKKK